MAPPRSRPASTPRRCSRGSACVRAASPPTAGRCARATRSPRSRAAQPTAARSSPTRSRAARAPCCGRRAAFQLGRRVARRQRRRRRACRRSSARSPTSSTAARRRRSGSSASPAPTARRRARTGSRNASTRCGRRAAVLGTLGNGLVGALRAGAAHDARRGACCTRLLAALRDAGAHAVAMEVSSHGLDQGRVNARRVRRRAVHQPHARPPRLPRHDGGLRRGQGEALRLAGARTRA